MPFIDLRDVVYAYESTPSGPAAPQALRGVTLAVERGEYLAIVGANASGKTTLALHLNGLLAPTSGSVTVDGLDTRRARDLPGVRQRVAMVFQKPEDQIVAVSVEEDTAFGPENLKLPRKEILVRVARSLERVGLQEQRLRSPHELSAGQKQRLAIAGALALEPQAIVLDEATSMLDPRGRRELLALLRELNRSGTTILHITHRMEEAAQAGRVVVMEHGRVAAEGAPQELFPSVDLASYGLERPSALELAARLSRRGASGLGAPLDYRSLYGTLSTALAGAHPRPLARTPAQPPVSPTRAAPSPSGAPAPGALFPPSSADPIDAPLIRLVEVSHAYRTSRSPARAASAPSEPRGAIPSLRMVSLAVRRGEAIALIGPTGSGKSTLLQHLNCLFLPQSGRTEIDGIPVEPAKTELPGVRTRIGLVFQRPEEQLFAQYVGDEVAYGPRLAGLSGKALTERVRWAMEAVGLPFAAYRDRLTFALSGGEQRKVGLAGVLALRPEALLLDEPTAGLDPASREELLALLARMKAEGTTIIISTHDLSEAGRIADRIVALVDGEIRLDLPTSEAFARERELEGWGLELPGFVGLIDRLAGEGLLSAGAPRTLTEAEESLAAAFADDPAAPKSGAKTAAEAKG